MNMPKAVFFDLDGTVYWMFLEDDQIIINFIFGKNVLVKICDKILRKINSFDILKNSTAILELRLFIYCILSLRSPKEVYKLYRHLYLSLAKKRLEEAYAYHLFKLEKAGIDVIIVSNNLFSSSIPNIYGHVNIVTTKDKRKKLNELSKVYNILYVVGNNYMDDILTAKSEGLASIYIGKSKLVKWLSGDSTITVGTLEKAVDYILS